MEIKKSNKLNIFLVALPSIGIGATWNMNGTIIPLLVEMTTKSSFELGILVAMASVTGVFGPYVSGILSDKLGKRKPFVLFTSLAGAIFVFCLGFSSIYLEMFIFASLFYLSMNLYQGSYFAWMPESVEKNKIGLVNGWGKLLYGVGGIVVFGFGVFLFDINPVLPFITSGLLILIPNIITAVTVKEDRSNFNKSSAKISFDFIKNSAAMKVFLTTFFLYLAYGFIMPYWLPYFEKANNFSSSEISLALVGFMGAGVVLSILIGILCDKYNKQLIFFITCLVYFVAFLIGMYVMNLGMLWEFATMFGVGFALFQVVFYAIIPAVVPKERLGEYMGLSNVFIAIPQIIGNLVGGILISNGDMYLLIPIALVSTIIAALICGIGKIKFIN